MQITDFSPSLARVRTISDTAVATDPASASDENISLDNAAEEQQPRRAEYRLGELPKLKLSQLMNKPVISSDGALLPFGGVTFSATGGRIRHLIVKMGGRSGTVFAVCGFENFRVARSVRIESTVLAERHATPDSRQARVFHGGHVLRKTDRRFDKKRRFKPFLHRKRRFFRGKSVCGGRRASFKAFRTVPDRAENSSEYAR